MKLTRRGFLGIVGASAVASTLTACDQDDVVLGPDGLPIYVDDGVLGPEDLFQHGVASADPTTSGMLLWTRVTQTQLVGVKVFWEIATDETFATRVAAGWERASAERDFTVHVDADDLSAGTRYFYRFVAMGRTSPVGRTKTIASNPSAARFAVGSCANWALGAFVSYGHIAQEDVDAMLHLGDYIYEFGDGEYGMFRPLNPSHECRTLEDYRKRYAQYRSDPHLRAMHAALPIIAVWDDHESANNSWTTGAEFHDEATEGPWADRLAAAKQAYFEWVPVRHTRDGVIHRSFQFGSLLDLFMLDTRLEARDPIYPLSAFELQRDPARTILGPVQEKWLFDGLKNSQARHRVIGQQVMMGQLASTGIPLSEGGPIFLNPDQWDGYRPSRDRLFAQIREHDIDNVVVLTGDIHASFASELTEDPWDPTVYGPSGKKPVGVEFITHSISSGNIIPEQAKVGITQENPQIKYVELSTRGYMILDVTQDAITATWKAESNVEDLTSSVSVVKKMRVRSGTSTLEDVPVT